MRLFVIRRGWWKPWNWTTRTWAWAIVIGVVISPFATRWFSLWRVPDVVLPFDVEEIIQNEIPRDEDAIVRYEIALRLLAQGTSLLEEDDRTFVNLNDADTAMRNALLTDQPNWDNRLDHWLLGRRAALDEFLAASEMERSGGPSLRTADLDFAVNTHQRLRSLAVLAEAEAMRLERSGQVDQAWGWHRANLRCARHCMMPRYVICQLIGSGVRSIAYSGIARWAQSKTLTVEQLQAARDELVIDGETAVPVLDIAKSNYLCLKNSITQPGGPNYLFPQWSLAQPEDWYLLYLKRMVIWTIGQPEIVLRLARQELINVQDQIDLPIHSRRQGLRMKHEILFELDPASPRPSGQLSTNRLKTLMEEQFWKARGLNDYLLGTGTMESFQRLGFARMAALDVVLACQQYHREFGEFPESLAQLVPRFLKAIPIDPMDVDGGLIQYRVDENREAVVWSIGYNEKDDGGKILKDETREVLDTGYRVLVNRIDGAESQHDNAGESSVE